MGRLFFLGLLSSVSVIAIARPWIGVVCAYFIAILTPQAVWYWNFDGLRPVMWVLVPTFVGFVIGMMRGEFDLAAVKNRRNLFILLLWGAYTLSFYAGPYVDAGGPYRFTDPDWADSTLNKIFILYFLGCICLDSEKKLKALVAVFIISAVYLIYWANDRYLSGMVMGRLAGPVDVYGIGIYSDENNFAMLFVVVLPFLWYAGYMYESKLWRYGLWLIIPFGWHAIFLTASRGGLVGVGVTTLLIAIRSKSKMLGLLLIPAFMGAYFWQAGDLMRSRAETIGEFRTETSAATRLQAWEAASGMIADYPLTGVGLASFGPAFPDYSENKPREAHNTFFQITAESGVLAGTMYLLIVTSAILALWRNGIRLRKEHASGPPDAMYLINEATLVAMCGLTVCSLFLSLQMFEIFYCLCLIINALLYVRLRAERGASAVAGPSQRGPRRLRRPAASAATTEPATDGTISPGRARRVPMLPRRT